MEFQAQQIGVDAASLLQKERQYARADHGQFARGPRSYAWLLNDSLVRDWIDGYTSEETRQKKLYQLEKVMQAGRLEGPAELLKLTDRDVKILVKRVANWYLQQGKGVWAKQIMITVRGFVESHDRRLEFTRSERIRTPPRKKIAIEHVPSKNEIYRMAENAGSARNKAVLLCLFQSGVRVSCLCNWRFGLVASQLYPRIIDPMRIRVTPVMDTKLNLYGLSYYLTGVREEASKALRLYLDTREVNGWNPQPTDNLFVQEAPTSKSGPLKREQVWRIVKSSALKTGISPTSVWVHCIRKSFRKILNSTPQIDEDTKEALMGHKLPGSRGNYFDYHDEDEVMSKYKQANFAPNFSEANLP